MLISKSSKLGDCCLLIISFFFLSCTLLRAQSQQTPTVNQLLKQLEIAKPDTNKVNLLGNLAKAYQRNEREKARSYANQELELSRQLNWAKGQVMAFYTLGDLYWLDFSDYQQALNFLLIGVDDSKTILGLDLDFDSFQKDDKLDEFLKHIDMLIQNHIGDRFQRYIDISFPKISDRIICALDIKHKSSEPVHFKDEKGEEIFYIRRQVSTITLKPSESIRYIRDHWIT